MTSLVLFLRALGGTPVTYERHGQLRSLVSPRICVWPCALDCLSTDVSLVMLSRQHLHVVQQHV